MSEQEIRPRIVGLENEYNWRYQLQPGIYDTMPPDVRSRFGEYMTLGFDAVGGYMSSGVDHYLSNGARYYLDMAGIPEYATPECASFAEVVAYDIAGEDQVTRNAAAVIDDKLLLKAQVNKRVVDHSPEPITSGAHENYHVDLKSSMHLPKSDYFSSALAVHLTSRVVFSGAGSVDGNGIFHKSQKLRTLEKAVCSNTTAQKPVVNTKNESLGRDNDYRVHVIAGDANISPWAMWMKLGTTSLVIRLIEHGMFPDKVFLDDIVTAAHVFGSGDSVDSTIFTEGEQKMTALDIQEQILENVIKFSHMVRLPDEELAIIGEWQDVLQDFRIDVTKCSDRVDWLLRQEVIDKAQTDSYSRRKRDLNYDLLYPAKGFGLTLRDKGYFKAVPGLEEIDVLSPPDNTRALVRGLGIKALSSMPVGTFAARWDCLMPSDGYKEGGFVMEDPYSTEIGPLVAWIDKMKSRY